MTLLIMGQDTPEHFLMAIEIVMIMRDTTGIMYGIGRLYRYLGWQPSFRVTPGFHEGESIPSTVILLILDK